MQDYDDLIVKLFTESIDDEGTTVKDKSIFAMNYCVPCPNTINSKSKDVRSQVCKKAFACVYGCTVNDLEKASDAVKASSGIFTSGSTLRIKVWKDDVIHDISYKETEELFMLNVGSAGTTYCIIWLVGYFYQTSIYYIGRLCLGAICTDSTFSYSVCLRKLAESVLLYSW